MVCAPLWQSAWDVAADRRGRGTIDGCGPLDNILLAYESATTTSLVLVGPNARPRGNLNRALVPGTPEPDPPAKPAADPATIMAVPLG